MTPEQADKMQDADARNEMKRETMVLDATDKLVAKWKKTEKVPQKVYDGLFETVKPKKHWKDPIDATIKDEHFTAISDAVNYFTCTELERVGKPDSDGNVRVKAAGYWGGPAAGD